MDYRTMSDEDLMDHVRLHNDNCAAHELFVRHFGRLVRRFRLKGVHEEEAEELAQETFFRVLRGRDKWRVATPTRSVSEGFVRDLRKWIDMIADNVLRDMRRKRLRHRLVELGVDPVAPEAEEVDYVKYARILLDLFHGLDEPTRAHIRAWLVCGASSNSMSTGDVEKLLDNSVDRSPTLEEAVSLLYTLTAHGSIGAGAARMGEPPSKFYPVCRKFMDRFAERVQRLEGLTNVR